LKAAQIARWSYVGLLVLQAVWHGILPTPFGTRNWLLAAIATLPLLLPLKGVWRGALRAMTWAGYLGMLYLVIGVMEAWANPPQRFASLAQVCLVTLFVGSTLVYSRGFPASRE
jgi:uncharacterized membrane protein